MIERNTDGGLWRWVPSPS